MFVPVAAVATVARKVAQLGVKDKAKKKKGLCDKISISLLSYIFSEIVDDEDDEDEPEKKSKSKVTLDVCQFFQKKVL